MRILNYLKWAKGAQNKDWFASNGSPIFSNSFNIAETGIHTVYYETVNKEKRVYTFNVTEQDLQPSAIEYGFTIDETSEDVNAVTYTMGASSLSPATFGAAPIDYLLGDWEDIYPFNEIKMCLLKDGVVTSYLDPKNSSKKLDGTNVSTLDGDVMVEIPKFYWKASRSSDDSKLQVSICRNKIDSDYKAPAHTKNGIEYDKIYLSVFNASSHSGTNGNLLKSVHNNQPTILSTVEMRRQVAQTAGVHGNASLWNFHTMDMLKILYVLLFKTRGKAALGNGVTDSTVSYTGNSYLFFKSGYTFVPVCAFGIHNIWGGYPYRIEGLVYTADNKILVADDNYNNAGTGYTDIGATYQGGTSFVSTVKTVGMTDAVFAPMTTKGAYYLSTCYQDESYISSQRTAFSVGGGAGKPASPNVNGYGLFTLSGVDPSFSNNVCRFQVMK